MSRLAQVVLTMGLAAALAGPVRAPAQESRSAPAEKAAGAAGKVIPVWPDRAPGSEGWTQKEVEYRSGDGKAMVRNVTTPTLTAFLPEPATATGAAVVICPGGGFRFLSWQSEGTEVAEWLRARGVAAFVLKYRLMETPASEEAFRREMAAFFGRLASRADRPAPGAAEKREAPRDQAKAAEPTRRGIPEEMRKIGALGIADGRQSIKVVRQHAAEWGIKPDRVGIMGFSAGGMVTMGVVMDHDAESRPDFAAPIYGGGTNGGKVPDDAPPLFILCASDDRLAAAGSARLYSEWKAANRPAELHIYEKGGHGFGMTPRGLPVDRWIERYGDWLAQRGLLKPGSTSTATRAPRSPQEPRAEVSAAIGAEVASGSGRAEPTAAGAQAQAPAPGGPTRSGPTSGPRRGGPPGMGMPKPGPVPIPILPALPAANDTSFYANADVPHGKVVQATYKNHAGKDKRMHVYLPPDYETNPDARYPVLYLNHGGGDDDSKWTSTHPRQGGHAQFILDNLIAAGKARPMIVVMPNTRGIASADPPKPGEDDAVTREYLQDIIPYVEAHYRARPGRENRALAGLSMGGFVVMDTGLSHLDTFSELYVYSSGYFPDRVQAFEENFKRVLSDPKTNEELLRVPFYMAEGETDIALRNGERVMAVINKYGVRNFWVLSSGGHEWANWRRYLHQTAQIMFPRPAGGPSAPSASPSPAQAAAKEIPLYPGAAPGSEKWEWSERSVTTPNGLPIVTDVVRPVLLPYPAEKGKAVGTAMIVAPGGGFRALMMSYEGVDIAHRLNAMGVDAFVLKYRLIHNGPGGTARQDAIKLAADDGRQAVRLVRQRAGELGYRPDRVGMIGFSAGGMVTSEALFGPTETRPDFAAIIYGAGPLKEVPSPAPPLFLAVAADDAMAAGRTVDLFTAYRKARGPAELHVFQMGAHGFVHKGGGADHFMDRLEEWLAANKLLSTSAARSAAPAASPRPAAAGVAGRWQAEFDSPVGVQKYVYAFKVDGETLTGTATGQRGDEKRDPVAIREGKVRGDDVSFVEMIDIMGMEVAVKYTGKIVGDEIRLKREVGDFATEELVARRVRDSNATGR